MRVCVRETVSIPMTREKECGSTEGIKTVLGRTDRKELQIILLVEWMQSVCLSVYMYSKTFFACRKGN